MSELEERIENLEDENFKLREFAETAAISIEQLWEIVRKDIQGLPVPNGVNLRNLI
jgi:hypothetical protein